MRKGQWDHAGREVKNNKNKCPSYKKQEEERRGEKNQDDTIKLLPKAALSSFYSPMVTINLNCGFESLIIITMQLGISSTEDIPDSYTQNSHEYKSIR